MGSAILSQLRMTFFTEEISCSLRIRKTPRDYVILNLIQDFSAMSTA